MGWRRASVTCGCVWHTALGSDGEEKEEEVQGCSRCTRSSVHLLLAAQMPPLGFLGGPTALCGALQLSCCIPALVYCHSPPLCVGIIFWAPTRSRDLNNSSVELSLGEVQPGI